MAIRQSIARVPTGLILAGCAVLAVAVWNVLDALSARPAYRVTAALALAFVAILIEAQNVVSRRNAQRQTRESETAAWERRISKTASTWPPTRLSATNMYQVGVKRPHHLAGPENSNERRTMWTTYVERDTDGAARSHLQEHGSVLFVGSAQSGVTRAAFETACAVRGDPFIFAPKAPTGLTEATYELDFASHLESRTFLLLWLDDIDRYRDLDVEILSNLRRRLPGLRIVATITRPRFRDWSSDHPELRKFFARVVQINRTLSEKERRRAQAVYPDEDFQHGFGAAFTAVSKILARIEAGYDSCPFENVGDCTIVQPAVEAIATWKSTLTPRPLTVDVLASILKASPTASSGQTSTHLRHVLAWLSEPTEDTPPIVTVNDVNGGILLQSGLADVLIEGIERPSIPIWRSAFDDAATAADWDAVGQIANTAYVSGYPRLADHGWTLLASEEQPARHWLRRAIAYSEDETHRLIGSRDEQRAQHEELCRLLERVISVEDRSSSTDQVTLAAYLRMLGLSYSMTGRIVDALPIQERAVEILEQELGPESIEVAHALDALAMAAFVSDKGKCNAAENRALEIRRAHYGDCHEAVATSLFNLSSSGLRNDPDRARDVLIEALDICDRLSYNNNHPLVLQIVGRLNYLQCQVIEAPTGVHTVIRPTHAAEPRRLNE